MPIKVITIDLAPPITAGSVKGAVLEHDELVDHLIGDIETLYDFRAELEPDSFNVDSVEFEGKSKVYISYSFSWSAYYGCRDMCKVDTERDVVTAARKGNRLRFEITVPEPRSTHEEF